MSNFNKVQEFNRTFGATTHNNPQLTIFDTDPELVKLRLSLVTEECQELIDAVKAKDFTETNDALADILYVVYGFFDAIGVDADEAFDIVQQSNMSKVCSTEEEAINSVQWYMDNMLDTYDTPAYKKTPCGRYWMIYNQSTNKVLKNRNYKRVDFSSLLKEKSD
tara:strand:- start:191 stop:682 length:492 start_codon:yes stop_codon:yes gene_type:complete